MKSLFSIYLKVFAVVLYIQFISSQLYDPLGEGMAVTVYRVLDPLLVLGMVIVLFYAFQRKRAVDNGPDDGVTREYLEANGVLYVSIAMFIALLWSWVGFQFSNPANSFAWLWTLIDITLPLLFFASSVQLVKNED